MCKGGSPRGINFYRERRIFGTSFLFFYVLIYHLFVFTAIRGQFHFCLLPFKRHLFSGRSSMLQHFTLKRISSFDFNRNLSFKAFNAFLNKSRFRGENVKIFARPKCLLVQQKKVGDDGGWHESRLCTTKVCHSAQSSIFEKARSC